MTAIERTAYPRLKTDSQYRQSDLRAYLPADDEVALMFDEVSSSPTLQLNFMLQLKTFQCLGYFVTLSAIPKVIVRLIRKSLNSPRALKPGYRDSSTKYKHRALIRRYLDINEDKATREQLIQQATFDTAQTMNDPANIINVVLEELVKQRYELPAFSSLDKAVCAIRHRINDSIFKELYQQLKAANKLKLLEGMLHKNLDEDKTEFNRLKRLPQNPTVNHFKELVQHNDWITELGDYKRFMGDISKIKVAQFAEEARSLDASVLKAMHDKAKKFSLMACLIAQSQYRAKDAVSLTFCRAIGNAEKASIRDFDNLAKNKDVTVLDITGFLLELTQGYQVANKRASRKLIKNLEEHYQTYGGTDKVITDCEQVLGKSEHRHLPLIYDRYKSNRTGVFAFLKSVTLKGYQVRITAAHCH